jgi:hypothetical protein
MGIVLFKAAVSVAMAFLGAWMLRNRDFESWSDTGFRARVLALQAASALGLYAMLYVIGHLEVPSDVANFYLPPARATLGGQIPLRDFQSSYAPLFPYVGAAAISLWNSGKVFVLLDVVLSALTLFLWHAAVSSWADKKCARESTILFASSGNVLVQVLLGTNQIWVAASLAASALLIVRGQNGISGLLQGAASGTIKILTLLFWPAFWICTPQRSRWLAGAILVTALIYGGFALLGADLLYPLRFEGDLVTSGNLPYLLEPLVGAAGPFKTRIFDGLAVSVLLMSIAWLYLRARSLSAEQRPRLMFACIALIGLVFMVMTKKSFTYAVFFMYPAILMVVLGMRGLRARIAFLFVFNVLLSAEPSLWYHLKGFGAKDVSLSAWLHAPDRATAFGLIAVDVVLIACYAWIAHLTVRCVRQTV